MTIQCFISCSALSLMTLISSAQDFKSVPSAVVDGTPLTADELEKSILGGVDFLINTQNPNGSWGSARKTKGVNVHAPHPGAHHAFRMASTCLALTGLLDSGDQRAETLSAIAKAESWMIRYLPNLKRADRTTTYNMWGNSYALHSLAALARRKEVSVKRKALYRNIAQQQIDTLLKYQDLDGGWGYLHHMHRNLVTARPSAGSNCFATATVLAGMHEAMQELEVSVPAPRLKQALASIVYQRNPDFSYLYGWSHKLHPRLLINRPGGSLARTQACNYALKVFGDKKITDAVVIEWLDRLVKRNGWLDMGRKDPKPHNTHFQVSGYYYYYGHYYAALNMALLSDKEQLEWKHKLGKIIIQNQDKDGSWWDFPLYNYHQAYGTGYALSTLSRCR